MNTLLQSREFAELILKIVEEGAEEFAEDLAFGGMEPAHLRAMAKEWKRYSFTPQEIADDILAIAENYSATA